MSLITITIAPQGPDTWGLRQQGYSWTILDNARVKELKTDIQDMKGIPEASQLLWFGTSKLADNTVRLGNVGVVNNSTVRLRELVLFQHNYLLTYLKSHPSFWGRNRGYLLFPDFFLPSKWHDERRNICKRHRFTCQSHERPRDAER